MKTLTLNAWGNDHKITLHTDHYANNGNLYVGLTSWDEGYAEPWSDLTVNLGIKLPADTAYIDTNNNSDRIVEWLITNGLGHLTGNMRTSGWCVYPEFKFNMDKVQEYIEEV